MLPDPGPLLFSICVFIWGCILSLKVSPSLCFWRSPLAFPYVLSYSRWMYGEHRKISVAASFPILMMFRLLIWCQDRDARLAGHYSHIHQLTTVTANATEHGMLFGLQFHPGSQITMSSELDKNHPVGLASHRKQVLLWKALEPFCEGSQAQWLAFWWGCIIPHRHFCMTFTSTQCLDDPWTKRDNPLTMSYEWWWVLWSSKKWTCRTVHVRWLSG